MPYQTVLLDIADHVATITINRPEAMNSFNKAMVEEFELGAIEPLTRLAVIVRGADTARPELVPEAAGLLAASLGLSRMYADDLEQLEAGMLLYDAFYRWCRDATDEVHNWTSHQPPKARP